MLPRKITIEELLEELDKPFLSEYDYESVVWLKKALESVMIKLVGDQWTKPMVVGQEGSVYEGLRKLVELLYTKREALLDSVSRDAKLRILCDDLSISGPEVVFSLGSFIDGFIRSKTSL